MSELAIRAPDQTTRRNSIQMGATLVGGMLLAIGGVALLLWDTAFQASVIMLLATLFLGGPLVVQAVRDILDGRMLMNELAALAVVAALAAGAASSGSTAVSYYGTAGVVAFFMIISGLVERRSALGAQQSIESLVRLTPTRAFKIQGEGEVQVDVRDLVPGDRVRVRPGDNIPGDGKIVTGESTVNQANITGESLPADKAPGDEVFGGTINLTGVLEVEITKAGSDTTLGRVQELIVQAQASQSPIMRLIDRYAAWYTPTILMLAGIVLIFTRELNYALTILIIGCPSAIILSTPSAMVAALSAAARLGVLIKDISHLETARSLTAIVFDKTGTLTTGELSVSRLQPVEGVDGAELLRAAGAAEQNSRHPVARAVVTVAERARLRLPEVTEVEEVAGRGVRAMLDDEEILVGRESWVREKGVDCEAPDSADTEGLSLLYVTRGGKLLGWLGLEDRTRPDAARAVDQLRDAGMKQVVMMTGDRWSVAKRVAAEMHCTDVQAEVLPAQKLEMVDGLKEKGHLVAVVGDGVNDAPALAAGDISMAMGAAGSDVAIHSASIALMNNNLNRVPFLLHLSDKAVRVVRQNLGFSIGVIVLGLALFFTIHPVVAVLLHVLSSLVVLFNSARLVRLGEDLDATPPEEPKRTPVAPEPVPSA